MSRRWPTVNFKEGENPFVTYFKKQVHYKNNCINAVATGMPGSGKSWSMLYLLSKADPSFDTDRIFFKASKMLRWINSGGLSKGKAFLFDEAGIDATNLNWWDDINKGLNAFFQTARSSNYIFGMTVPFLTFISKGVRTLMNVKLKAEGWSNDNKTIVRPHILEYNGEIDKFYRKRLLVREPGGSSYCNKLQLPKADQHLIDEYEKMKVEFKSNLYKNVADKLTKYENATMNLTHRQKQYYELRDQGYNREEASKELGITNILSAYQLEQRIRNKGYEIPENGGKA